MNKYLETKGFIFDEIETNGKVVLATCNNNQVAARTISVIVHDNKIYFQTDLRMDKAKEIEKNNNVAICIGSIQIKGTCKHIGKPAHIKWFVDKYKNKYPNAFALYSRLEYERVFEIEPTSAKVWTYIQGEPYIKVIDFEKKEYVCNRYLDRGENYEL